MSEQFKVLPVLKQHHTLVGVTVPNGKSFHKPGLHSCHQSQCANVNFCFETHHRWHALLPELSKQEQQRISPTKHLMVPRFEQHSHQHPVKTTLLGIRAKKGDRLDHFCCAKVRGLRGISGAWVSGQAQLGQQTVVDQARELGFWKSCLLILSLC